MASFKGNGRGEGSKRRSGDPRRRHTERPDVESLEQRRLLSGGTGPSWHPSNSNLFDGTNGPMANLGKDAIQAYRDYLNFESSGGKGQFVSSLGSRIMFEGTSIGIDVRGYGDFTTYKNALDSLGMTITATVPAYDLAEGYFPLANLPELAEEGQTIGGVPMYRPVTYQQGISPNQSDLALNAPAARAAYNVNGAGQKIGVLSDSVNQYQGGVAASVATGDLPKAGVQIIQDGNPGDSDEGRAMLEQIYDIAPAASLAFATASGGEASFAANIEALYAAGATTIVDDLGYFLDPFYQDGIIQQAVNTVVGQGATYLSSAGNQSDSGYESQFRGVSATIPALGAGTYQNFDPSGATQTTQLGINVYGPGGVVLQFDQPFYTTNGVVSNVELDILDQAGNLVAQANSNNVAMQTPTQITGDLPVGLYNVVIKVDSGPNPQHVVFYATGDAGFSVDQKFGSAGQTYYPSTHGHNAGANTISTGAVPYWGTPAYVHTPAIDTNESFSSTGPVLTVYNPDGTPLSSPVLLLKPDISAPEGNNTSFFIPGDFANTTMVQNPATPPYPGDPVTTFSEPTTAVNQSVPTLPNFFGTSAAAPNLAAVVALMKESNPTLNHSEIIADLIATTTPLDNIPKGTWGPQSGYGLADAFAAITAAQQLKVAFISPGGNQTVTSAPSAILVEFTQPVNLATVLSTNLKVTGANGSTVTVGNPVGVDSATFPTLVSFPITITPAPGKIANGLYKDSFVPGSIVSKTGTALTGTVFDQFNVQQVNGPQVANTSFVGRIVNITFNEAVNPATVTPSNLYLFRTNGTANPLFGPTGIIVSQLPGALFSYNAATHTATIDLTNVPQSSLPTDHYALFASSNIIDGVGNHLNGQFSGVFPSGIFPQLIAGESFLQDLGIVQLQAPIISYLTLAPVSDTGITGDNNTNIKTPSLVGQVTAKFPGTVAGLLVYAEFNGISHPGVATGGLDLGLGSSGRGFVGHYDVQTITNATGGFTIVYPAGVTPLPEGENRFRVVVVGQADLPPFPGLSSSQDAAFRIDNSDPYVGAPPGGGAATSIAQNSNINSLTTLTLNIVDPVNPTTIGSPFAVDPKLAIPALNPTLASTVSNYRLYLVNVNGSLSDKSNFITSATFTSTSARVLSSDPYTGQITLTFGPGLPEGSYKFLALSSQYGQGLADAAGNPFAGYSNEPAAGGSLNYELDFNLQPTPTYITDYEALTADASSPTGFDNSGARANYEIPVSGVAPRAPAPPSAFTITFSNPLTPNLNFSNLVELVRSANTAKSMPDGDFGDLGITNSTGFTTITGITVTLQNSIQGATFGQFGFDNQLLIKLPPGLTLPADYYRVYLPNASSSEITDIYGNQLDGEFLGYQNASGKYVDQLPSGQVRGSGPSELPDLSGDGTPGGAFMTGFVVVPNGNIIYARADALYNPQIPSEIPNGSFALPYPVLAPEAVPTAANGGDLNSVVNSGTNFNTTYDRSGDGQFEPSAFFAAQQRVQLTGGPVVILAEQSVPSRDPITGAIVQKPFVLEAPSPSGNAAATIANDASAAVPALTVLNFGPGTILKMQNAALLVQNQGSALEIDGGPNSYQTVTITSYKDSSVGGVSNGDANSVPSAGDYGGIVFRNFSEQALPGSNSARSSLFPGQIPVTGDNLSDDRLKGPFANTTNPASQVDAISGADDILSYISYLTESYAGGAVPQTVGIQYDGITLLNSRPTIVNTKIAFAGGPGSAQAGLSVDVNSLRADDVAQGPLLRADTFINNGLNGIYIRAEVSSGIAEPTNAILYPSNPAASGGNVNYVLDDPYPYLLTSRLEIGRTLVEESGGAQTQTPDRLYIDPGMLVKFELGAGIEIDGNASLNVGDQTYIKHFDADNTYGPTYAATQADGTPNPLAGQVNPNFVTNSSQLAMVVLTSLYDDTASTTGPYINPNTGLASVIVQPLSAVPGGAGVLQPTPGNVPAASRWGGIQLNGGSVDVINSADFRYGGGVINTPEGSSTQHVLEINPSDGEGTFAMITNNLFTDNVDVPVNLTPNALMAGDPERPLASGDPFIHGNVFQRNGVNGVGIQGGTGQANRANLDVNSVWTGGDFTYILRDTIVLGPDFGGIPNIPSTSTLLATPTPNVTLTLQSTVAGTVLADGTTVAAPGVPIIIKLENLAAPSPFTDGSSPGASIAESYNGGAGFLVGVDNGVDAGDQLIDPGAFSQIRILGIGANQTTGQSRVPVIITSIHDDTVGTTVNNVSMFQAVPGDAQAPAPGDGGVIDFGGNSLTTYNLEDPRSGSVIDNADIKYMTRIEQQGGGVIYTFDLNNANSFSPALDNGYDTKLGLDLGGQVGNADQYNQAKQLTISDSNLSSFSDVGFVAHPGYGAIGVAANYVNTSGFYYRVGSYEGEATHTFLVDDTFSNMPTAVEIISENLANSAFPSPAEAVLLNNTFYNDKIGLHTIAPVYNTLNAFSHNATLTMDNIFSNISGNAIEMDGQDYGSEVQYNLFFNTGGTAIVAGGVIPGTGQNTPVTNDQPVLGDPAFRDPANGNFNIKATSAAIDLGRSELGPSIFGDMLYPASSYQLNAQGQIDLNLPTIRNNPTPGAGNNVNNAMPAGDINPFGGLGAAQYSVDIVTLPGEPVSQRGFPDQFIPVLPSYQPSSSGTGANAATYNYTPIVGERDQLGNLRVKDPNSPNVGFGSRPFFDLGAFEYIIQNPPVVDAVTATTTNGTTNIYGVGTVAGTNKLPTSINFQFSDRLDTSSISGMSVLLVASGGDGIFGNANDKTINLSGLLTFNPNTDILSINTSGIFTSTATANDEYRIILKGVGPYVIRDTNGLALDGLNLNPAGNQVALPSGADQFPGSDFQVTFTIDTHPPAIISGTFKLDPASDSSGGLNITNDTTPTFDGSITDIFPPANPVSGQTVFIDVSSKGNGIFDLLDAGTGTTDINGNFKVTLTTPIPPTTNTIGAGGIQGAAGANYAQVRVRVVDQAGNVSNQPTDPFATYLSEGAVAFVQVDTKLPQISAFSPLGSNLATVNASGQVVVSVTFTKNIKTSSLNANSIMVERTGGTGSFAAPINVPIVATSFTEKYLNDATGSEVVTFAIAGPLPNDEYEIILKGTGATPITDLAANPLSGAYTGTFPTGSATATVGTDFDSVPFVIYQPSQAHLIYVQAPTVPVTVGTGVQGTRENPFATIGAAMAKAFLGDDVLVLPGTYKEDVTLKPGVRLLSATTTSTDTTFTAGNPFQTLIYGVPTTGTVLAASNNYIVTVAVTGSVAGIPTEISGFSIISPLIGNTVTGTIDSTNSAILATNSNVSIDRNNIINGGIGVNLSTSGTLAATSTVFDNVIAGNIVGVSISDLSSTISTQSPFMIVNNTIADNTIGLQNFASTSVLEAFVLNNIFFSNHDLTPARNGTGVASNQAGSLGVGFNDFYQNGASSTNPASNASGSFGLFIPAALTANPDALNNYIGNPSFVQAEDPRPNGDTPAVFFNYANYDLTGRSAAINTANQAQAPATDFLYRSPVRVAGHGFANTGPASDGAYYYLGTGGPTIQTGVIFTGGTTTTGTGVGTGGGTGSGGTNALIPGGTGGVSAEALRATGGSSSSSSSSSAYSPTVNSPIGGGMALGTNMFTVLTTSLSNNGTAHAADGSGSSVATLAGPSFIDVNFSDSINPSTLNPTDLVLSGTGLSPTNPAHSTSYAWIDDHAVRFYLSGGYNTSGTVNISIPAGAIVDTEGASLLGFNDSFQLASTSTPTASAAGSTDSTTPVTPTTLLSTIVPLVQPIAAAGPVAISTTPVIHPSKHVVKTHHAVSTKETTDHHATAKSAHHKAPAKPAKAHHAAKKTK